MLRFGCASQSNGSAEHANQQLLQGMKRRLHEQLEHYSGTWVDELPSVLWSIRITPSQSTGCTHPSCSSTALRPFSPLKLRWDPPECTWSTKTHLVSSSRGVS